jgi:hypothetical protein
MGSGASREKEQIGPTGIKDVHLSHALTEKYMGLSQHGKVQAEFLGCEQADAADSEAGCRPRCSAAVLLHAVPLTVSMIHSHRFSAALAGDQASHLFESH